MGQRKAPSPLTAPIKRLRATGAKVTFGEHHHITSGALKPWIHLVVTLPGADVREISHPGLEYREVVATLNRLAEDEEAINLRNLAHAAMVNARRIEKEMAAPHPVDYPMAEGHALLLAQQSSDILSTIQKHRASEGA